MTTTDTDLTDVYLLVRALMDASPSIHPSIDLSDEDDEVTMTVGRLVLMSGPSCYETRYKDVPVVFDAEGWDILLPWAPIFSWDDLDSLKILIEKGEITLAPRPEKEREIRSERAWHKAAEWVGMWIDGEYMTCPERVAHADSDIEDIEEEENKRADLRTRLLTVLGEDEIHDAWAQDKYGSFYDDDHQRNTDNFYFDINWCAFYVDVGDTTEEVGLRGWNHPDLGELPWDSADTWDRFVACVQEARIDA
ncbi:MAG: hypothetical protein AB7I45_01450 [Planctomycetota bacterium]